MTHPPVLEARAELLERFRTAIAAELPAAIALRRELHADPEPSGSERRTAERVVDALGLGHGEGVAGTGRVVRIGGSDGPCVALRAELDGLPGPHGMMHACGHDVHLAALVALGRAARRIDEEEGLPAPILALFQPREERPPSGARDIVSEGVLTRHRAAAVVAAHVQPQLPSGRVAAVPGAVNAAADHVDIVVTGRGGHGGYPHLTRDPVVAIAQVVVALQQVVSRRIDPLHAAVLTIGTIQAGSAANVIPDEARAEGTLRLLDETDRAAAHEEVRTTVEHAAAAAGCTGTVTVHEGEPALVNDPGLAAYTHHWLTALDLTVDTSLRSCGADDFSYFGAAAPSLMMFVGLPDAGASLHHPSFDPPDEVIADVAHALLAGYLGALDLME
ncbi:M20 metallopeptidase family protein [Nocardioides ultimimeridianus]